MNSLRTTSLAAVLFDVDGVLVDSLDAHLTILRDKSREFALDLAVPNADQVRAMLRRGVKISPMAHFFSAIGMPEDLAGRADRDYRREFMVKYCPPLFRGVDAMLESLVLAGVDLGIVTSNTLANVHASLGSLLNCFVPALVFDRDRAPSKEVALLRAASSLSTSVANLLYVGDQSADYAAAQAAGARFLAVSYGWEFEPGEPGMDTVDSPTALAAYILSPRTTSGSPASEP